MTDTMPHTGIEPVLALEAIIPTLIENFSELTAISPDWNNAKIQRLRGQGATSRQFLIGVPTVSDGQRKFFIKQYIPNEMTLLLFEVLLKRQNRV